MLDHTATTTGSKNDSDARWFYIRHKATNKVISIDKNAQEHLRSQVLVTEIEYSDYELWTWDDHYLKNKETGLVLDIRKGKLRLIEDTDICLFHKKPIESAQNQLWAVMEVEGPTSPLIEQHPLIKQQQQPLFDNKATSAGHRGGHLIHPLNNSDWVLDVCPSERKLILFPYDYDQTLRQQTWDFIPEKAVSMLADTTSLFQDELIDDVALSAKEYIYSTTTSFSSGSDDNSRARNKSNSTASISSISTCDSSVTSNGFAHGLTPAKRASNTPVPAHVTNRKRSITGVF